MKQICRALMTGLIGIMSIGPLRADSLEKEIDIIGTVYDVNDTLQHTELTNQEYSRMTPQTVRLNRLQVAILTYLSCTYSDVCDYYCSMI